MSHQIDLSSSGPFTTSMPETEANPQRPMLAYLYFVVATILLCSAPALIIAAWRWAL